ncbi:MAG: TonB-dependent receptor plug domain-containing protein, partial [Leptolyngbyaceae bacterium]|nr:TonB-dependent receptor plug domain-containing protein [Leptolyngbyaceae bacterium]
MAKAVMLGTASAVSLGLGLGWAPPAFGEENGDEQYLTEMESPTTKVADWIAQIEASQIQVTGVRITPTDMGLSIVLETAAGDLPAPTTQLIDNAVIAEIPNAALDLPEGEPFERFGPVEGIALVSVMNMPNGGIRVTITGTDAPPQAELSTEAGNVVLSVLPSMASATNAEANAIQVVVTGEQDDGYTPSITSLGTGTNTPLLDIPASIQVITEEAIEDQRAFDLLDVLRNTPGITTGTSPRDIFNGFTIRGFATSNTLLRNGVADNDVGRTGLDLTNVERVEVLRGPASILYGQIAPGGVINIVTKRPLPFEFYDVEATYGSFNTYQGALDLSGPLTGDGSVSYRLNASIFGSDTFIDEIDIDRYLVAPVLTWNINDQTDLTFEIQYLDAQYPNERGLPIEGTILPNPNGDIPFSTFLGEPGFDRNDRRTLRLGYDFEHRFNEDWGIRNTFGFTWEEDFQDSVAPRELQADLRTLDRRAIIRRNLDAPSFYQNSYVAT